MVVGCVWGGFDQKDAGNEPRRSPGSVHRLAMSHGAGGLYSASPRGGGSLGAAGRFSQPVY